MDRRAAPLHGLCGGRLRAPQGCRTVRADRACFAGWFGDGAVVVALSAAEKWGGRQRIARKIIVVLSIGKFLALQCGRSELKRGDHSKRGSPVHRQDRGKQKRRDLATRIAAANVDSPALSGQRHVNGVRRSSQFDSRARKDSLDGNIVRTFCLGVEFSPRHAL